MIDTEIKITFHVAHHKYEFDQEGDLVGIADLVDAEQDVTDCCWQEKGQEGGREASETLSNEVDCFRFEGVGVAEVGGG